MTSTCPPGLFCICPQLGLPCQVVVELLKRLAPLWTAAHPAKRFGRPRIPLRTLLFGVLIRVEDGTTLRRTAARVGVGLGTISRANTELLKMIAGLGIVQPDGTFLTAETLTGWLKEMAVAGEVVLADGCATRCPRPGSSWVGQKVFWDAKHDCHAYNTIVLTTGTGDLLAVHGGWPGAVTESEQLTHAWFAPALIAANVRVVTDRGFRPARKSKINLTCAAGNHRNPQPGDAEITRARSENERGVSIVKSATIMVRTTTRRLVSAHHEAGAAAVIHALKIHLRHHPL